MPKYFKTTVTKKQLKKGKLSFFQLTPSENKDQQFKAMKAIKMIDNPFQDFTITLEIGDDGVPYIKDLECRFLADLF